MGLEKVIEHKTNEWVEEAEEAIAAISDINNIGEYITLREFETNFLPFIIGEVEHNETNIHIYSENMLEKAGSYGAPLLVKGTDGNVKYTLPPFLNKINNDNLKSYSFYMLGNMIADMNDNKGKINTMLNQTADMLNSELKVDGVKDKYRLSLSKIYKDYSERFERVNEQRKDADADHTSNNISTDPGDDDIFDY